MFFFFLRHGVQVSRFSHYSSLVARQISWGTSESAPPLMLTLACVVHADWCFHGNGGAAWVVAPPEREGQRRAAFHRASTQTEKHTNRISLLQNKTIMLVRSAE